MIDLRDFYFRVDRKKTDPSLSPDEEEGALKFHYLLNHSFSHSSLIKYFATTVSTEHAAFWPL